MWHLLDDDVLSHIATIGVWESLHVLRQLERRCAQIEKATTRLQCIRPLFFPPFSLSLGEETSTLEFTNCVDDRAMQVFAIAIASGSVPKLELLSFLFNDFGDVGMQAFASVVASGSLPKLEKLFLSSNSIGDVGMQAFASAVASGSLPQLRELSLFENQIGDGGMQTFTSAVASGSLSQLRNLDLWGNQIGDVGMQAFSSAVASGSMALTTLHLGNNEITDGGFATLMPLLRKDGKLSNLTEFSIGSAITDEGMKEFADILVMGTLLNLTELWLLHNPIGDVGMQAFASAVANGGALTQLKVHSLATALLPCPERWHTHSLDSEVLFDV